LVLISYWNSYLGLGEMGGRGEMNSREGVEGGATDRRKGEREEGSTAARVLVAF